MLFRLRVQNPNSKLFGGGLRPEVWRIRFKFKFNSSWHATSVQDIGYGHVPIPEPHPALPGPWTIGLPVCLVSLPATALSVYACSGYI